MVHTATITISLLLIITLTISNNTVRITPLILKKKINNFFFSIAN
jgi:hypothetical protein